ncbi:MAG: VOC family protein [Acidimicrobiales bacterium]
MTVQARRLNHAVLYVRDLDAAVEFYSNALGMDVVTTVPQANAAFLRLRAGDNHHDLGIFARPQSQDSLDRPDRLGLYHLAWQVDTIEELAEARTFLVSAGAYTGESDHGASKSVYAKDPSGNELELMWMVPRESWGQYESDAPVRPLDLEGEIERWSGVQTAG